MRAHHSSGAIKRLSLSLESAFRDRSGAIMILTAISMPLMMLVIGFAADYGFASYINQRLARAADMAAISAVSQAAATDVGGYGNLYGLQYAGNAILTENLKQLPVTGVTANVSVVSDGNGGVVATATYSYAVKSFFGGVIGRTSIPVSGTIQSTAKPATYQNYYILVDASQSMGIATTQADMVTLYNRVIQNNNGSDGEAGCIFACHVVTNNNYGVPQLHTNEYLAHNISPTVTLRIDSAVQAIQSIISTASATVGTTKSISFGLYTIQANPNTPGIYITTVASPSNNYTALNTAAASIDLGSNNAFGRGDTDYVNELAAFATSLPANGSGASAASPQNFVFLITDGVTDTFNNACTSGHCTGPLDSTKCTPLKAKSTLGVIYTTYAPIMDNPNNPQNLEGNYSTLVAPFASQIAPALQSCATSSSYFFQANYGSEIISAVQALFNQTLPSSARLTQ